jgi:hypothetical protein
MIWQLLVCSGSIATNWLIYETGKTYEGCCQECWEAHCDEVGEKYIKLLLKERVVYEN